MNQHILRLVQSSPYQGKNHVQIELLREKEDKLNADVSFYFNLTNQDQERLRWYFEDYLQYTQDPAPLVAYQVEGLLVQIGIDLFRKIFQSQAAKRIWEQTLPILSNTRIEIVTDVIGANIPWEMICDPDTTLPLALSAASFTRIHIMANESTRPIETIAGPIRILLAICRPAGKEDVPFRSVASRVISSLSKDQNSNFQLDLLRPPTFEQLRYVLERAKSDGKPYHIFHFDGHGAYDKKSKYLHEEQKSGARGYLFFENPTQNGEIELVDGTMLGNLLRETKVPIVVLNACRSAYSESPHEPKSEIDNEQIIVHERVRVFGSLAQEVIRAGIGSVVAMRYVIYVVTAAQFVAELYNALAQGSTLENAINLGRKQLYDQSTRKIAFREHELQDWSVPVIYSSGQMILFPRQIGLEKLQIKIGESDPLPIRGSLDTNLPPEPDTGFFGRDETLLAIDRAFDSHRFVLLHAFAGQGKTSTAVEFAKWYSLTGGVRGPILFTSFERYLPLTHVLDKIGQMFCETLENQGIYWPNLNEDQKRDETLQLLRQEPILWIWDNVEQISGFPIGMESAWNAEEQRDLFDFLKDARDTEAKFLLTSRREERAWLGDLPFRMTIPPMPMFERIQLARALADGHGKRMVNVESWKTLLKYTEGNPLTITVLVSQALREGLSTTDQIEMFVDKIRSGEMEIDDDERQGRSKSLGASLKYGSQNAFDEKERRLLAILSFFQGYVDTNVLGLMGQCRFSLDELQGLDRENGIKLLDKASDVGMLTALGNGFYRIHPALPWFFHDIFKQCYREREDAVARAFVKAVGLFGNYLMEHYNSSPREILSELSNEEANMLYAWRLSVKKGWWDTVIETMQGLSKLYEFGRWKEWERLVNETAPFFAKLDTDAPIIGREEDWSIFTGYRVDLAIQSRQFEEALRMQEKRIEWHLEKLGTTLSSDADENDEKDISDIWRNYIKSIGKLAEIQNRMGNPRCIRNYEEAIELCETYGFRQETAAYSMHIGNVYMGFAKFRNLDKAEWWFRRSLESRESSDRVGCGQCLISLGNVAWERYFDSRNANRPKNQHLVSARKFFQLALDIMPQNAVDKLAEAHNAMANVYRYEGKFTEAHRHFQQAICCKDELGETYNAARYRRHAALNLKDAGRLSDAMEYARSALKKFEDCGPAGTRGVLETQSLIAKIEEALKKP